MKNFVSIASARGGGLAKMSADKMLRKKDKMRKKTSYKSKQMKDLEKKPDVFKE